MSHFGAEVNEAVYDVIRCKWQPVVPGIFHETDLMSAAGKPWRQKGKVGPVREQQDRHLARRRNRFWSSPRIISQYPKKYGGSINLGSDMKSKINGD